MNKKSIRSNARAPTAQPVASIAPSATLALDGDLPLASSHGVSAPAPLAAHDVLHAAMMPRDDSDADTAPVVPDGAPQQATEATPAQDDAAAAAAPTFIGKAKGSAKKPAKSAAVDDVPVTPAEVKPVKPAKVAKEKFVDITFSLPESEAGLLDAMKKTHQGNGVTLKKGQLLRAGLLALADLDSAHIARLVAHLPAAPVSKKKKKQEKK